MSRVHALLLSLAVALALPTGCAQKRYKWVGTPYCKVDAGKPSAQLKKAYRVLTKTSNGGGVGMLNGARSGGIGNDHETHAEVLVAVVTCANGDVLPQFDLARVLAELTDEKIPLVCNGQTKLLHQRVHADTSVSPDGYAGLLRFPPIQVECTEGTPAVDG